MHRLMIFGVALGATALALTQAASAKTVEAVSSISIIGDMVKQVGGERVKVTTFVGPDGDPHAFEPSPANGKTLKNADLAFVNGLGLDKWVESLAKSSAFKGKIVTVSDGIKVREAAEEEEEHDHKHGDKKHAETADHDHKASDPHAWNNAANGIIYVENIAKALVEADPEGAETYKANAARYVMELKTLDDYARAEIGSIPQAARKVVTNHDALGYFGDAYGVEFLAVEGLSTEAEPSAKAIAALIDKIRAEKVKVYFIESSNDSRLVKQVAKATAAQSGGELYVESLGKPGSPAATYTAMFKHNVELLVAAMKKNDA